MVWSDSGGIFFFGSITSDFYQEVCNISLPLFGMLPDTDDHCLDALIP